MAGCVCHVPISGSGDLGSSCWRTAPQYALYSVFTSQKSSYLFKALEIDIKKNKADFFLPRSFSYCLLTILDSVVVAIVVVEYSSSGF